jgi:small subunit ribosomal protein S17e
VIACPRHTGENKLGKVRTETVKRAARELIERFPDKFTSEFEANKTAVNETVIEPSKKLRNLIAGYATRLKVTDAKRASMMQMSPEDQLGLGEDEEEPAEDSRAPAEA